MTCEGFFLCFYSTTIAFIRQQSPQAARSPEELALMDKKLKDEL
jgi:hypothetical protein